MPRVKDTRVRRRNGVVNGTARWKGDEEKRDVEKDGSIPVGAVGATIRLVYRDARISIARERRKIDRQMDKAIYLSRSFGKRQKCVLAICEPINHRCSDFE